MLFLILLLATPLRAGQNATLYGTVYDAGGAPAGGVVIALENSSIGISQSATTTDNGTFRFLEIPPAPGYKVAAIVQGKKVVVRSGITVNVDDEKLVLPPLLLPAPTAATQEAGEQPVTNETISTAISGVITGEQLRSLPLYNRNFLALGLLTPNVRDTEPGSELAGATFSIAGSRPNTNNFLLDGADNVASGSNQAVPFQVNDAVQEFRVISATAPAEYGRNAGGVVNIVTRRGGNAFHGSAFGYFANDAFNADSPLSVYHGTTFEQAAAYAGSTTPVVSGSQFPSTYNDYVVSAEFFGYCTDSITNLTGTTNSCVASGFGQNNLFDPAAILAVNDQRSLPFDSKQVGLNLGGPLQQDKWFLFGSYEGTFIDNPNAVFERVPSTFDRTYHFYLTNGIPGRGMFPYAFPSTDPSYVLADNVVELYPVANVVGVPGVLEFFRGTAPNYTNVHNFLLRTDYQQSERSSWTARYVAQKLAQLHDASLPEQPNYPGNGALREALNQNLSTSFSHGFSSSVINEVRAGYNRFRVEESAQDKNLDATSLGLPSPALPAFFLSGLDYQSNGATVLAEAAFAGWFFGSAPLFPTLDGFFPFARMGAPLSAPSERRDTTLFFADNLSWSRGRHSMKMGFDFRHLNNGVLEGGFARGFVYSSNIGEFTSDSASCNQICGQAFINPSFDYALRQPAPYRGDFHSFALAGYFQDTWRLHPRWTLNLGVRYEYFSVPEEKADRIWNFDVAANGLVQQNRLGPVLDPSGATCGQLVPVPHVSTPAISFGSDFWTRCTSTGSGRIANSDRNNLAPRAGISWDVRGNGKTVARAGVGWFYDHLPLSYVSQLLFNRPTPLDLTDPALTYGRFTGTRGQGNVTLDPSSASFDPFEQPSTSPFAIYARDVENSNTPFTRQISASIQQSINDRLSLEAGYVGTSGEMLPVVFNENWVNQFCPPAFFGIGDIPWYPVFTLTHQAESTYHSLLVRVRAADWHGLHLNAAYNWAKGLDNASNGVFALLPITLFNNFRLFPLATGNFNVCLFNGGPCGPGAAGILGPSPAVTTTGGGQIQVSRYQIPQDPLNFLEDERGRSDFDVQHRLVLDYTWNLPSLHKAFGWPNWLDDWQVSGIVVAQSGQPFTIFAGPLGSELTQRVNVLGPVSITSNPEGAIDSSNLQLASQACLAAGNGPFTIPGPIPVPLSPGVPCTGDSRRNAFTGPGFAGVDLGVQKRFALGGEQRFVAARVEFYNLLNRANFYNPISALSLDGITMNSEFGRIKSSHNPRQIQFAVRFTW